MYRSNSYNDSYNTSGIVTRCPLELRLRRQKGGLPFQAKITYRDKTTEFTDLTLVEGYIKDGKYYVSGEHTVILYYSGSCKKVSN